MRYYLVVIFTGLIGFSDFEEKLYFFLVKDFNNHHTPYLGIFTPPKDPTRPLQKTPFNDEELTISGIKDTPENKLDPYRDSNSYEGLERNIKLNDLHDQTLTLKPGLTDFGNTPTSLISGRVIITHGTIQNISIQHECDEFLSARKYGYISDNTRVATSSDYIGNAIAAIIELETSEATLTFKKITDPSQKTEYIAKTFPISSDTSIALIFVSNMAPSWDTCETSQTDVNTHFKSFYNLIEQNISPSNRMYPSEVRSPNNRNIQTRWRRQKHEDIFNWSLLRSYNRDLVRIQQHCWGIFSPAKRPVCGMTELPAY